jgi:copper oxidase (laccase) domain-containing protein
MKGDGITKESTVDADAVVVTQPNHGILLPLADCIGTVIYDSKQGIMMVSHLGRHNLEQDGGKRCIDYLIDEFGCVPQDLLVFMSPSAGKKNYPLYAFDNRGMNDVAIEQLQSAGVISDKITHSLVDTTTHPDFYSHSNYLRHKQAIDGRFAILAYLA